MKTGQKILKAQNLSKTFGSLRAVADVSLEVREKEILGLVGPNGSGKTTLLNLITNFLDKDSGEVFFRDEDVTDCEPYDLANRGLLRTFQLTKMFKELTVRENLEAASSEAGKLNEIIEFLKLKDLENKLSKNIPRGQQKLVGMGRALLCDPSLLLLDEPTAGIDSAFVSEILKHIKELREDGVAIVVVEHNMKVISELCDNVVVLDHGEKIAEGTFDDIQDNEKVKKAYLG